MNNQLHTLLGLHDNTYFRVVFENLIAITVLTFIPRIFILLKKHVVYVSKYSTLKLNLQWYKRFALVNNNSPLSQK